MRLEIGNRVRCTDAVYGELADIVIDPLEKRVTHLVVRPEHRKGEARLVPIELAKRIYDGQREIELECSLDEAQRFASVHEAAYLRLGESPAEDPDWDVGVQDVLALPYYSGLGYAGAEVQQSPVDPHMSMYYDRVPKGDVEVRVRAPSSRRTAIHWARWTASWSTRTSTSPILSSSVGISGDGRR